MTANGESQDFRQCGQILCGKIAMILGWRPHEFWDATPAEIACILSSEVSENMLPIDRDYLNDLIENEAI